MQFLRKNDQVSAQQVADFAASIHSQRQGIPGGGMFISIIDRGSQHKTKLIEYVWNNRRTLSNECNKLAEQGQFKELLNKFSMFPGIQPVKAGFIVQLLYGQMGCLDIHNIRMYSALSSEMQNNQSLDKESREKWKELGKRFADGKRTWIGGVEDKENSKAKMEKTVDAYHDILGFMNKEMGFTPRVLWDFWVNYVAQRYEDKKAYSNDQGLVYNPDDKQLKKIMGGQDRVWTHERRTSNVIQPHPASGAVSRVHLMAAITPDDLIAELERNINNKYHIYNATIRNDNIAKSAIQLLSNRINDIEQLKSMVDTGRRVNATLAFAKDKNTKLLDQLKAQAENSLRIIFNKKYKMKPLEAEELVNVYTITLKKLYKAHMSEIKSTILTQDTKTQKLSGIHEPDDEQLGFKQHRYDPKIPFSVKGDQKKLNQLQSRMNSYIPSLKAVANSSLKIKKLEKELIDLKHELEIIKRKTLGDAKSADQFVEAKRKVREKIKKKSDLIKDLKRDHKFDADELKSQASKELDDRRNKHYNHLHGPKDDLDDDDLDDLD